MPNVIEHVQEKLKRTNESIRNLDAEIAAFFQEHEYPIIPEDNKEITLKAIEYHKSLAIPSRFSVLAGEVIHHLRSCLDHLAWQFSSEQYRRGHPRRIEFPIFEKKPVDKESISRYEGKIKGIANPDIRSFIESLQPYHSPDPVNDPLFILHDMDIFDKHRELILISASGGRRLPPEMKSIVEAYEREHPEFNSAEVAHKFKGYGELRPQVSFTNFGRREFEPVVLGLLELYNEVVVILREFDYRWGN